MLFKIVDGPISEDELFKHVRADEDGAVLTFAGVVRNHGNNQNTEYLSKIVNNAKDTILKNDFN